MISKIRVKTETGQAKTLGQGNVFFQRIKNGSVPLCLGLGPNLDWLSRFQGEVFLIEVPEILQAVQLELNDLNINLIAPAELDQELLARAEVWVYRPSVRYFPSFWLPVWAKLYAPLPAPDTAQIWILAQKDTLLVQELERAIASFGFGPKLKFFANPKLLQNELSKARPQLVLSLNGRGLDEYGVLASILLQNQIPLALWLVDNPWHVLSKFKGKFFTKFPLFVTDSFFIPHLRRLGVDRVFYLPLAGEELFFQNPQQIDLQDRLCFVGRASFPNRQKYFAGQKLETRILVVGQKQIKSGKRADYSWFVEQFDYPEINSRFVGAHLEKLNLEYRLTIFNYLRKKYNLTLIGDSYWQELGFETLPPVDYYTGLKNVYFSAKYILNLTSFHLPWSLNQRHFDVWLSGGFLLTDYTPGLELFAKEAVELISFKSWTELEDLIQRLERDPSLRYDLQTYFCQEIRLRHTYKHRLEFIFEALHVRD